MFRDLSVLEESFAGSALPNYELDPLHLLPSVTIQRSEITRGQALHLTFPSGIGHFNPQHGIGKLQRPGTLGYRRPANQRPREYWGLALRHPP
jgi:hypothetical protein